MSYLKLPKTVQDHAVGYQSVVQAVNNGAALVEAFDSKHSIGVGGDSPYGQPTKSVGRHDDILVARSVAEFKIVGTTLVATLAGPIFGALQYARLAAGQWQIFLATPQLYGATALMKSSASVDYKATCYTTTSLLRGPSIIVTTWNIATANSADLPFSLVVWTQAA